MPDYAPLILAPLIVLVAYVIFGISGFGSTLIAVPLLAHMWPLKFVIPVVVILDCIAAIALGTRLRAQIDRANVVPLLPFLACGMVIGVLLLVRLPASYLMLFLGVFIFGYGLLYATGRQGGIRFGRWWAAPIGMVAGTVSSTIGVGGPLYVLYFTGRGATPDDIRATMPVIFVFTTTVRIVLFGVAGLFTAEALTMSAALLPVMGLGIWIGNRMHLNLSRTTLVRIIGVLLIGSGVSLLIRAAMA